MTICPDCRDGKCAACLGDDWDHDTDQPAVCQCWEHGHARCEWCGGPGASEGRPCMVTHCDGPDCRCPACADEAGQEAGL